MQRITGISKTRALFVLPSLRAGGAERVAIRLLEHLPTQHVEPHLAVVEYSGKLLNQLRPGFKVHNLGVRRTARAGRPLLHLIWTLRPQVVLTMLPHVNLLAALLKRFMPSGTRLIIRETNVSSRSTRNAVGSFRLLPNSLKALRFRFADTVICQSVAMHNDIVDHFPVSREKMVTIHNPIDFAKTRELANLENPFRKHSSFPNLVVAGSLTEQKGIDRLIAAFPKLLKTHDGAAVWVLGTGTKKACLQEQARRCGVGDRVHFVGFQENPFKWFASADLFVLPSRYEGTPNVLTEAITCGCPVIALEHPGGTREVLELTGQAERMVKEPLAWSTWWFDRPDPRILRRAREAFDVSTIVPQYAALLHGSWPHSKTRRAG